MVRRSPQERFAKFVAVDAETGCHEWTGAQRGGGYGQFGSGGARNKIAAHRQAYIWAKGPIPAGFHIDHLCRNRLCVNAEHLEAVTPRENILRGEGLAAVAAKKTSCPQEHPYDAPNTYRSKSGHRHCLACNAERRAEYWSRRRGIANEKRRAKYAADRAAGRSVHTGGRQK